VTVVAVATALPKGMIIPKMKKGIPSTGHCEEINDENSKVRQGGPFLLVVHNFQSSSDWESAFFVF
jgi:hypothetical protein